MTEKNNKTPDILPYIFLGTIFLAGLLIYFVITGLSAAPARTENKAAIKSPVKSVASEYEKKLSALQSEYEKDLAAMKKNAPTLRSVVCQNRKHAEWLIFRSYLQKTKSPLIPAADGNGKNLFSYYEYAPIKAECKITSFVLRGRQISIGDILQSGGYNYTKLPLAVAAFGGKYYIYRADIAAAEKDRINRRTTKGEKQ